MTPVEVVLDALERADCAPRKSGRGWASRCKGHPDEVASLSVAEGQDGRALLTCFAGCTLERILESLGLARRDLFRARENVATAETSETRYRICDRLGNLVAVHVRRDGPKGKAFHWERGGKPSLGGLRVADMPLYRAETVASSEGIIFLCEGEKAADALVAHGFNAVATCCGAAATPAAEVLSVLADHDVVVWPDNDDAGRAHMARIVERLRGIAASVRVFQWPDAPEKGDAFDFFEQGGTANDVRALIAHAASVEPANQADDELVERVPRPIVVVRGELGPVTAQGRAALLTDPDAGLYVRARRLVRVGRDSGEVRGGLRRAPGAPIIEPVSLDALRNRLDHAAKWVKPDARTKDLRAVLPPEWVARSIAAADSWPFPPLAGVVEAPTMKPDGELLDQPGYDASTGLLYLPSCEFPPVPKSPTGDQVGAAVALLREPFGDFPMVSDSDRAAAVAATFSVVARPSIEGCVPMFAARGTAPGTGKGLLADVVSRVGTGRSASRMVLPSEDDEIRKALLAVAFEGTQFVLLDNIDRPLGSTALAAALTSESVTGRLLGSTAMLTAPLRAVWLVTGNGLTFKGDLGRRVVPIDMDARVEHPEDRTGFRHPDLLGWVSERRGDLVAAALTVLRGFHVAGRPVHGCGSRMGSFEAWDDLVRGACAWAGFGDPVAGRERIRRDDDGDLAALRAALGAWRAVFGRAPTTAAEAISKAGGPDNRDGHGDPALRDALLGLTPNRDKPTGLALGHALRRVRGRVCGGLQFDQQGDTRTGAAKWVVLESAQTMQTMQTMFPTIAGENETLIGAVAGNIPRIPRIACTPRTGGEGGASA